MFDRILALVDKLGGDRNDVHFGGEPWRVSGGRPKPTPEKADEVQAYQSLGIEYPTPDNKTGLVPGQMAAHVAAALAASGALTTV